MTAIDNVLSTAKTLTTGGRTDATAPSAGFDLGRLGDGLRAAGTHATRYGLGAVVFGADDARTSNVARALTAGMIGVNQGVYGARGTPWVGARESGFAFHSSRDGHRNFTQTRVLSRPKQ